MKHPPTLALTMLVLRTRVFALGAAHRANALAAPRGVGQSLGAALLD